ncbi:MAG: hypothetical protein Q9196_003324 [Gyalolechia fulgens]
MDTSSTLLGYMTEAVDDLIEVSEQGSHIVLEDPTISNVHLRIYSIRYDPGIEPFVYAENLSTNGVQWLSEDHKTLGPFPIPKGEAILLSNGDKLLLSNRTVFVFQTRLPASQLLTSTQLQEQADPDCRQILEKAAFDNLFAMTDRKLGSGISGRVFMVIDRLWLRQMACKIIQLKKCHTDRMHDIVTKSGGCGKKNNLARLWREVDLLKELSHPNIIKIDRVFHTEFNIYIIEEFITGGDLMSYIERHGWRVNPEESCLVIYQILKAVSYLHQNNITHRDLKPENILMSTTATGARVVLTDFGGATRTVANSKGISSRMQTMTGTPHYVAPEIRGKNSMVEQPGYTSAVDMWSIGCVAAAMLIGRPAFTVNETSTGRHDSAAAVIAAAAKCDLRVLDDPDIWGDIGIQAKDFIKRLLVLDERDRLTADQALSHVWFTEERYRQPVMARYDHAVAGWKPNYPGWDFKEHLDRFINARITASDVSFTFCLILSVFS